MGSWFITILWCGLLLLMNTNPDNFVDDRNLDQSMHISWRDLPDWEEGLGEFLTGILERSHSATQWCAPTTDENNASTSYTVTLVDEVARSPEWHDY
jgi:hypothetical protein